MKGWTDAFTTEGRISFVMNLRFAKLDNDQYILPTILQ